MLMAAVLTLVAGVLILILIWAISWRLALTRSGRALIRAR